MLRYATISRYRYDLGCYPTHPGKRDTKIVKFRKPDIIAVPLKSKIVL
jgi:hypothetical protein